LCEVHGPPNYAGDQLRRAMQSTAHSVKVGGKIVDHMFIA